MCALFFLSESCIKVQDLHGCAQVTDVGINRLYEGCLPCVALVLIFRDPHFTLIHINTLINMNEGKMRFSSYFLTTLDNHLFTLVTLFHLRLFLKIRHEMTSQKF